MVHDRNSNKALFFSPCLTGAYSLSKGDGRNASLIARWRSLRLRQSDRCKRPPRPGSLEQGRLCENCLPLRILRLGGRPAKVSGRVRHWTQHYLHRRGTYPMPTRCLAGPLPQCLPLCWHGPRAGAVKPRLLPACKRYDFHQGWCFSPCVPGADRVARCLMLGNTPISNGGCRSAAWIPMRSPRLPVSGRPRQLPRGSLKIDTF